MLFGKIVKNYIKLTKCVQVATANVCVLLHLKMSKRPYQNGLTVVRSQNFPENGPLLRDKAQELVKLLKHDSFQCSEGWLDRFKVRHNIVFREVCGEAASASEDVVEDYRTTYEDDRTTDKGEAIQPLVCL